MIPPEDERHRGRALGEVHRTIDKDALADAQRHQGHLPNGRHLNIVNDQAILYICSAFLQPPLIGRTGIALYVGWGFQLKGLANGDETARPADAAAGGVSEQEQIQQVLDSQRAAANFGRSATATGNLIRAHTPHS